MILNIPHSTFPGVSNPHHETFSTFELNIVTQLLTGDQLCAVLVLIL